MGHRVGCPKRTHGGEGCPMMLCVHSIKCPVTGKTGRGGSGPWCACLAFPLILDLLRVHLGKLLLRLLKVCFRVVKLRLDFAGAV